MPQLLVKLLEPGTDVWKVVERIGEYNSDIVVPRKDETLVVLDTRNIAKAYKVIDIEYIYATILDSFRLYHVCCYVESAQPLEPGKYLSKPATKRTKAGRDSFV